MTGEVEIVCIGDTAYIPDLGLRMTRGSRFRTSLSALSRSKDIETAKAMGMVVVKILKAATIKSGDLPIMTVDRSPNQRATERAAHPAVPANEPDQGPVVAALREMTLEFRKLRDELREAKLPAVPPAPDMSAVWELLRLELSKLQVPMGIGTNVGPLHVPQVEERFIPSGIVTGTDKVTIATTTSSTPGTSGLDDADAALREARRRKKQEEHVE